MDSVTIRDETERDHDAVGQVHRLAFAGKAEARLVAELRRTGDAAISLVAERHGQVLGHVLFSRLQAPMRALALAPVAVRPEAQGQGIGSALIRDGLARARRDGWAAVFVVGAPAYYARFGFSADAATGYECPYNGAHFMMAALGEERVPASGRLVYPAPFAALG